MNKKKKIVAIIDDDPDVVEALEDKLKDCNYETLAAYNGKDGLEFMQKNHPDFLILDIIMPKMDGLVVLQKMRESDWGKNVPVMILTNVSENEKLAKALEIGVDDYKIKADVKLTDIVESVKKILGDSN